MPNVILDRLHLQMKRPGDLLVAPALSHLVEDLELAGREVRNHLVAGQPRTSMPEPDQPIDERANRARRQAEPTSEHLADRRPYARQPFLSQHYPVGPGANRSQDRVLLVWEADDDQFGFGPAPPDRARHSHGP